MGARDTPRPVKGVGRRVHVQGLGKASFWAERGGERSRREVSQ